MSGSLQDLVYGGMRSLAFIVLSQGTMQAMRASCMHLLCWYFDCLLATGTSKILLDPLFQNQTFLGSSCFDVWVLLFPFSLVWLYLDTGMTSARRSISVLTVESLWCMDPCRQHVRLLLALVRYNQWPGQQSTLVEESWREMTQSYAKVTKATLDAKTIVNLVGLLSACFNKII